MNFAFKENQLDYETYYILRKSVKIGRASCRERV